MIICKSQILIYKIGESKKFDCEILVVRKNSMQSPYAILTVKSSDGRYRKHNIEEFSNTIFYEYLAKMIEAHQMYELNEDTEYLLSIFEDKKALRYIDSDEYFESFSIDEEISEEKKVYARITSYEIDTKRILKEILGLDEIKDLYSDSFDKGMDRYISKRILNKINFLNSIDVHRYSNGNENIEIRKIDRHGVFKIILNSLDKTNIKEKDISNLKIAYTQGFYIRRKNNKKAKSVDFIEDCEGNSMVIIAKRGLYTAKEIVNIFHMDYFLCFSNIVVGISDIENVQFLNYTELE